MVGPPGSTLVTPLTAKITKNFKLCKTPNSKTHFLFSPPKSKMEVFVTCKATNVREIVEVDEEETVASLTAKAQKRLQCPPLIDVMLQTASGGSIGDGGTAVCNSPLEAGEALELVQMDPTPCEPCTPPKIRCPEGMPELQGFKSMLLCRAVTISDNNNVRHPRTLVIYEICGGKEFVIYLMKGVSVEQAVNVCGFL